MLHTCKDPVGFKCVDSFSPLTWKNTNWHPRICTFKDYNTDISFVNKIYPISVLKCICVAHLNGTLAKTILSSALNPMTRVEIKLQYSIHILYIQLVTA